MMVSHSGLVFPGQDETTADNNSLNAEFPSRTSKNTTRSTLVSNHDVPSNTNVRENRPQTNSSVLPQDSNPTDNSNRIFDNTCMPIDPNLFCSRGVVNGQQQLLTPNCSLPMPLIASLLGNHSSHIPLVQMAKQDGFSFNHANIIPLCFPSSFPASLMFPQHESLKFPPLPRSPLPKSPLPKDPFLPASNPVLRLMASPPLTMDNNGDLLDSKYTVVSSPSHSGIPILKIENPLYPDTVNTMVVDRKMTKSPDRVSNEVIPVSSINSSFCISSILANTTVLTSNSQTSVTNTVSSDNGSGLLATKEIKKKKNRFSPYRISNNTLVTSSRNKTSMKNLPAAFNANNDAKPMWSTKKTSPFRKNNFSHTNGIDTSRRAVNTPVVLNNNIIQATKQSSTATLVQTVVTPRMAPPSRPSSLQLTDNTSADSPAITLTMSTCGSTIGPITSSSVVTSNNATSQLSSPPIVPPQTIDNNTKVPLSLTVVTDEWKRSLEKQLRVKETVKFCPLKKQKTKNVKSAPNSHKRERDDKSKRRGSNVLSRPPMNVATPAALNQAIFGRRTISSSTESSLVSPGLPLNLGSTPVPLTSPSYNQSPLSNTFKSYNQLSIQTPILRPTSPALFVPRAVSATPSPASTPSIFSGEILKASNPDIRTKGIHTCSYSSLILGVGCILFCSFIIVILISL